MKNLHLQNTAVNIVLDWSLSFWQWWLNHLLTSTQTDTVEEFLHEQHNYNVV